MSTTLTYWVYLYMYEYNYMRGKIYEYEIISWNVRLRSCNM